MNKITIYESFNGNTYKNIDDCIKADEEFMKESGLVLLDENEENVYEFEKAYYVIANTSPSFYAFQHYCESSKENDKFVNHPDCYFFFEDTWYTLEQFREHKIDKSYLIAEDLFQDKKE